MYSASLIPSMRWRWCEHPPYSYQCYVHNWSPCETLFGRPLGLRPQEGLAVSLLKPYGKHTVADRFVLLPNISEGQFTHLFNSVSKAVHASSTPRGRLWWMGLTFHFLLRPLSSLDHLVDLFLAESGLLGQRYVVIHVRRGHKFTEERPVPLKTYTKAADRLCECYKTPHVFAMTEDNATIFELAAWAKASDKHLVYTDNERHNSDVWNVKLGAKYNLKPPDMDLEGYIAVFNLFASRKGIALVGAFGSTYTKVVGGAMYSWHNKPMAILSVQEGWETADLYKGEERKYYAAADVPTLPFECMA